MSDKICAVCKESGTEYFSRCDHILHKDCFEKLNRDKECPKCDKSLSNFIEYEEIFVKLNHSDFYPDDIKELSICFENFSKFRNSSKYKSVSYDGNILSKLQRLGWNINDSRHGASMMFNRACETDDIFKVNLLIDHGIDLEKYGAYGLELACLNSSFDTFEKLIRHGVKIGDIYGNKSL